MNKSVLKKMMFYVEDDESNRGDFNCEILTFTCLFKKKQARF